MPDNLFEIDATSIDAKAINAAYYGDGAFIVRRLLPTNLIKAVVLQLIELVGLLDDTVPSACPISASDDAVKAASWMLQEVERRDPGSHSVIYDAIAHTPLMHQISTCTELMQVLHQFLSPHLMIHPRLIVLMSMPKATWHLARWHQDYYYNKGPKSTCTLYAPLQYTDARNGGLIIAKKQLALGQADYGSHDYGAPTKWNTLPQKVVDKFDNKAQIEMYPGDVLLMHSLTPHNAQVNETDDVRFVINLRYRDMLDAEFLANKWRVDDTQEARQALERKNPLEKTAP